MAIGTALGLIGLLASLVSSGIGIGKGVQSSNEDVNAKRKDEEIKRQQEAAKRRSEMKARRNAIAKILGVKSIIDKPEQDISDPYQRKDLSGFDTAAQISGAVGQLASGAKGLGKQPDTSNEPQMITTGYSSEGVGNATYSPSSNPNYLDYVEIDTATNPNSDIALGKKRNNLYGDFLTRRG